MKSNIEALNKSSLLIRLERNQRDLLKMKSALTSYICEPRTPGLFERCESLKYKLDNLSSTNNEIIRALQSHKQSLSNYVERVKNQFQEFYLLQQGVDEYVTGARNR